MNSILVILVLTSKQTCNLKFEVYIIYAIATDTKTNYHPTGSG